MGYKKTAKPCCLSVYAFSVFAVSSICILVILLLYKVSTDTPSVSVIVPASPHYICPVFRGGLGNHLFMYASMYGIAKTKSMILVVNEKDHINTVFPNTSAVRLKNTTFCDKAILRGEVRPCAYDQETLNFDKKCNIRFKAYLQSWRYFEMVKEDLKKQFVFQKHVQEKAKQKLEKYISLHLKRGGNKSNLKVIGVHIRRGDYLLPHKIQYGYKVASKTYIDKAFNYFRLKYNNCLFLVFTGPSKSDIKLRESNIKGNDTFNVEINQREIDMCALTMCDHMIITVGSFGWWSAWLANGTTVYFKDVARENSALRNDYSADMEDFFPPEWIGLT